MKNNWIYFSLALFILHWGEGLKVTQNCTGYDCLKAYVDEPDSSYSWEDTGHRIKSIDPLHLGLWTGYVLNFTSQTWLTPEDSNRPVWYHIMVVIVPSNLQHTDTSVLWITGGNNNNGGAIPTATDTDLLIVADFAVGTGVIAASLYQVPNQNIVFSADPLQSSRSEDGVIAFTWHHFVHDPTKDAEWLLRLPMTKAAMRAMDTIAAFATSNTSPPEIQSLALDPTKFFVAGGSKRGWTTWTVAAVDPRVTAIAPVVMDDLNFVKNLHHHWRAYGGWSFALIDYYNMNVTLELDNPDTQLMMDIVDPYEYRDKLVMPKMVINAGADEFFLPDDTRYWWYDMPMADEMNRFLMVPNAEHSEVTGILEVLPAVNTWARELLQADALLAKNYPGGKRPVPRTIEERNRASVELMGVANLPRFTWNIEEDSGDIRVMAETKPTEVRVWHATTCDGERRDFRIVAKTDPCTCGLVLPDISNFGDLCLNLHILWSMDILEEMEPGSLTWVAHMDPPEDGKWTAFFVDMLFDGPKPNNGKDWPMGPDGTFDFTSSVSIVPNTFPFPDCQGEGCYGKLV